ncbi:hypothetical protein COO20_21055 [Thalassospira marina]|uniref:Uncharacterized protein n=1 Tax=Thalassospira marina TaxID=2048283 RepID=A0A2N3KIK7_9PROT|nr:hypothetical protein COO20_21055 [Thalassospira marina]
MVIFPGKVSLSILDRDDIITHRVRIALNEIVQDVRNEVVDLQKVENFSDLHAFVDANLYVNDFDRSDRLIGPYGKENRYGPQDYVDLTNQIIDRIDKAISNGHLARKASCCIEPLCAASSDKRKEMRYVQSLSTDEKHEVLIKTSERLNILRAKENPCLKDNQEIRGLEAGVKLLAIKTNVLHPGIQREKFSKLASFGRLRR